MKKLAAFVLAALLMVPVAASAAEYGIYVTPKIGGGIQGLDAGISGISGANVDSNEGSFGGGLAIGYDFNTQYNLPIRTELEYTAWTSVDDRKSYSDSTGPISGKGEVGIQSLFANVYLDWHNSTNFTPYIGAGIGFGFVDTEASLSVNDGSGDYSAGFGSNVDTNFAWNVGLGCSYAFTDTISADLSYRYASFGDGESKSINGYHVNSDNNDMHQFMLGVRFTF